MEETQLPHKPIENNLNISVNEKGALEVTKHAGGRPTEYNEEIITKTEEYIKQCVDDIEEYHKTRGDKSDTYERIVRVRLPTIEGLAVYLKVGKQTLYDWEKVNPKFLDVMNDLRNIQADRLINNGMNGDYSPVIAKVLLTKHGYREGIDQTTNDKDMPIPILKLDALLRNNSDKENIEPKEQN